MVDQEQGRAPGELQREAFGKGSSSKPPAPCPGSEDVQEVSKPSMAPSKKTTVPPKNAQVRTLQQPALGITKRKYFYRGI